MLSIALTSSKQKIAPWDALVWAYAHENVRAANAHLLGRHGDVSSFYATKMDYSRGVIGGMLASHIDAIAIDAIVQKKLESMGDARDGYHYTVIAKAAEARTPIKPRLKLAPYVPVPEPSDRFSGKPKVIQHPVQRRPWYCPLRWEGVPPDEAEKLQARQANMHAVFVAVLACLDGTVLERWHISSA